ncbi:hypothetical protein AVEN_215149-1 [Araneus ventricosus]|uniref:DUF5641 domain-containing protein n=1 Tax=Araneus ventricosus TaxID=182803 RepID=A0A4Y2RSG2_ARAVE|nr:hypothetical protein AVEN_7473-1 [Araneus ventricosus]GBN78716.1 hypothetical protein AVEN_191212-1 [Araneus ventricosus]GBN78752.1 hypothetical protein AVEN_44154-1 [Araneus ventricosus]GBN78764.1 hypothetical protein AVEN_82009-1 [Araneus ventricosus]GBN78774.1 hypothetical protein AVEN_121299-1 [Araneus ventricosus]
MDLDGLLLFLLHEIEGEERVSITTKCFTKYQSPKPWNTKHVSFKNHVEFTEATSASTLIATSEKNPNACIFCSGIHESGDCIKARKMSTEERQKAVQNSRSCFLCLEKGHVIAKCRRKTSCVICGKKHHILLCRNIQAGSKSPVSVNIRKDESKETVIQRDETLANLARTPNVLLQTLMVTLRGRDKKRQARAIIDSASQRSYILKSTSDEMQFESSCKEKLSHSLFGGTCTDIINHHVFTVFLSKTDGTYHCNFKALGQDVICGSISPIAKGKWLQELRENNISFSDKNDGPIEILIGADIAGKLMTGGFKLPASGPAAIETKLGWTVFGKNGMRKISDNSTLLVTSMLNKEALISDLRSLETLGILDPSEKKNKLELQEEVRDNFLSTAKVNEEGRFQVSLPWLDNHLPLKDNYDLAVKRLDSTVKRLKAEKLYDPNGEVFNEWKQEGIIEEVPKSETLLPCHYLLHRHIVKENSTTRIRPVFDASVKQKGSSSLNYEEMYTVLCNCEAILNDRPLTVIFADSSLTAITPANLSREIQNNSVPAVKHDFNSNFYKRRLRYIQNVYEAFRKRFCQEYLGTLKTSRKKFVRSCKLKEGDIVLIGSDDKKRLNWPLGKIIQLFPGTDGESRRVRLKVQNGEVIRAVQNLYPLELSSTEEFPSKFNQNCRCKNISPEQTPFDDAPVKSDGTIIADIKLPTITKSGRTVRIPRRLDL